MHQIEAYDGLTKPLNYLLGYRAFMTMQKASDTLPCFLDNIKGDC